MNRQAIAFCLALLIGLGPAASPAWCAEAEKTRLTYLEPGRYLIKLPVLLASAAGYFAEEGLDVDVRIAPGMRYYEALLAGDADLIAVSYGSTIILNQQGKAVHTVACLTQNCLFHLVAQPGVKSLSDLKGKRIGVPKVGEEVTAVIRAALKREGLDPDADVKWVTVGIEGTMLAAMKRGDIDAVGAVGEWRNHLLRAVPGTHVLIDYSSADDSQRYLGSTTYPLAHVQMTREFVQANPKAAQGVVNAMVKALRYIDAHSPKECIALVKDKYWADADYAVLVEYLTEIKAAFSPDGVTTKAGYEVVTRVNAEAGLLNIPAPAFEEFTDLRFVEAAGKKLGLR